MGRIGQIEQVCLKGRDNTWCVKRSLEEEERIPIADVSISKGGS